VVDSDRYSSFSAAVFVDADMMSSAPSSHRAISPDFEIPYGSQDDGAEESTSECSSSTEEGSENLCIPVSIVSSNQVTRLWRALIALFLLAPDFKF
jgi:hypothetical protein